MSQISVIAAVKNEEEFQTATLAKTNIIFHLGPNIMTLGDNIKAAHDSGKSLFIHIDLAEGIAKDKFGIQYIKSLGVDGVISTRTNLIKLAKEEKLYAVQRFFVVDSKSVDAIIETVKTSKADMIEVMPGVVPKIIRKLKENLPIPIIAGGLIETKEEVAAAIESGACAISTGSCKLW